MKPLTVTMADCYQQAKKTEGFLYRYPGGYWMLREIWGRPYWGTSTIEGMVKRGALEYVEWKEGKGGKFPVKAKVVE